MYSSLEKARQCKALKRQRRLESYRKRDETKRRKWADAATIREKEEESSSSASTDSTLTMNVSTTTQDGDSVKREFNRSLSLRIPSIVDVDVDTSAILSLSQKPHPSDMFISPLSEEEEKSSVVAGPWYVTPDVYPDSFNV